MSPKLLAIRNWLALILMLTVNTLANTLPINGYNTGQVSAFYPNLFVPDGFTFSIWSVIYLLLIGFVVISTKWLVDSCLALFAGTRIRYYHATFSGDADLYIPAIAAFQNSVKPRAKTILIYTLCSIPWLDFGCNHCKYYGITCSA
jgi:hypothetical protein